MTNTGDHTGEWISIFFFTLQYVVQKFVFVFLNTICFSRLTRKRLLDFIAIM